MFFFLLSFATSTNFLQPTTWCARCVVFHLTLWRCTRLTCRGTNTRLGESLEMPYVFILIDMITSDSVVTFSCSRLGCQAPQMNCISNLIPASMFSTREKKVIDLCKSQQKVYSTFADELSDYIQIQRARGITTRPPVTPPADTKHEDEDDEEEEAVTKGDIIEANIPNFPPTYSLPHHSRRGCYKPKEGCRPPFQGPPWPSHGLDNNCPLPVLPGSGAPLFTSQPIMKRRHRKPSSSSSYVSSSSYSSSYSSSCSSSTSDSDDTECRYREKRRITRSRRERDKRPKDENSDRVQKRRKRREGERHKEAEERRRGETGGSEEERRRTKSKTQSKQIRREKKPRVEDFEPVCGERLMDNLKPGDMTCDRKETEVHIQAEMSVEQRDGEQDEPGRPKYRREKKKVKEKADTRTEEEKLWDDSILGF